jgi:hypothetical protein
MREFAPAARFEKVSLLAAPAAVTAIGGTISSPPTALAARQLIRTAELQIQVDSVQRSVRFADSIAVSLGGMTGDNHQSVGLRDARTAQLVLRVPGARLGDALAAIRKLGDVKDETTNIQDISREYADLETRLAVKEQTVERLRALLGSRTAKLSDVLDVERELARSVTELEQMKGEKRFDDQQVAMSAITVRLFDRRAEQGPTIAASLIASFQKIVDVFESSVAMLVYAVTFLVPWVVVAAALGAFGWRIRRSRRENAGSATA